MEYDILLETRLRPLIGRQFSSGVSHRYDPITIALVGTAASASAGTAATAGLIGAAGAVTAGGLATAGVVAGGVITGLSQIQQGRAAKAQGKAEKRIAEFNAAQKEREARSRVQAASIAEERVSKQEKITKAQQRADLAKSGITLEGSPLDVLAETAGEFATERALTLREGTVASNLLKGEASMLRATGQLAADIGRQKQTASFIKAGGTIISTAAAVGPIGASTLGPTVNQSAALSAGQGPLSTSAANTFVANANAPASGSSFAPKLFTLR